MVWEIFWSQKAKTQLKKLRNKDTIRQIRDGVEDIKDDPYTPTKQLVGSTQRIFRVGKYRVILSLNRQQLLIYVVKVDKRAHSYNRI